MKSCSYCGKENTVVAIYCAECGSDFISNPKKLAVLVEQPVETAINLAEPDPDVEPGEDCVLCPACLFPNLLNAVWCKKCGVPISATATITPLEAAQSMGTVYRGAVTGKGSLVILLGAWLLFGTGLLLNLYFLLLALEQMGHGVRPYIVVFGNTITGAICGYMLAQSTKNYRNKRVVLQQSDPTDAGVDGTRS